MKIVGLTGGIGSGKSVVAAVWHELGAMVLEADLYGHVVLEKDREARRALVRRFGRDVILPGGQIDRRTLAARAFATPQARRALNRIVGAPLVKRLHADVRRLSRHRGGVLVVDAALLCEWKSAIPFDLRVLVTAPRRQKLHWLSRRGLGYRRAILRMQAQWPDARRRLWADVEIRNGGSLADLRRKARQLWRRVIEID